MRSGVLGRTFKIYVSTTARKCIIKAGSLDNYLLNTKPEKIDSKWGLHVRDLIKKKMEDPAFEVPYIQGSAKIKRAWARRPWDYKNLPSIFMPMSVRMSED